MVVLDTSVLSDLMRMQSHPAVFAWVAARPYRSLFTTSINQAEILAGLAVLPAGKRREALGKATGTLFGDKFAGRLRPFDSEAARCYAVILAERRLAGRPIAGEDAMIAGVARARGAAVATRDEGGFAGCGLAVLNPWLAA